ncbi:MAG: hypothetical protein C0P72_006265 [Clostridia bacterium]|nr:hypothetical protein [Clostridia bacterium]PZN11910.1 MAG: hypothetical protein DIU64_01160 [Caldicoprobacter oshimai]
MPSDKNKPVENAKQSEKHIIKKGLGSIGEMFSSGGTKDNSDLLRLAREINPPPKKPQHNDTNSKKD